MRLWKIVLTLIVMAAWLPATAHCQLEALGIIPLDECCETTAEKNTHSHSACKDVEDSSYKTECAATLPTPPDTLVVLIDLCALLCPLDSAGVDVTETEFQTHHLPQFVIMTAQPIRGPSFAS